MVFRFCSLIPDLIYQIIFKWKLVARHKKQLYGAIANEKLTYESLETWTLSVKPNEIKHIFYDADLFRLFIKIRTAVICNKICISDDKTIY